MAEKRSTKKNTFTIYDNHTSGLVQIADDVIAMIAAVAATEVEGVHSLGGGLTYEKAVRSGGRSLSRGIKIDVLENVVSVRMIIQMNYGYNIPDVTRKVQEKVKTALENMTGLEVAEVAVSVANVILDQR